MKIGEPLLNDIKRQINHCLENYNGDQEELKFKLECLVVEWFLTGAAVKIQAEKVKQQKGSNNAFEENR